MYEYNEFDFKINKTEIYHKVLENGRFDFLFFNATFIELYHINIILINEFDCSIKIYDVFNQEIIFESILNKLSISGRKQYKSILDEFNATPYFTSKQTLHFILSKLDKKLTKLKNKSKLEKYTNYKTIIFNEYTALLI